MERLTVPTDPKRLALLLSVALIFFALGAAAFYLVGTSMVVLPR
jgi:hypothetical protein